MFLLSLTASCHSLSECDSSKAILQMQQFVIIVIRTSLLSIFLEYEPSLCKTALFNDCMIVDKRRALFPINRRCRGTSS